MQDIRIKELFRNTNEYADKEITVRGWIRTNRGSNKFGFVELNDGSFFKSLQVVYEADKIDNFQEISKAPIASALKVRGTLVLTPEAKQPFELKAEEVEIEAGSDSDYPLQKKRHSLEYLREIAHLRPRSNTFSAVFRVRSLVAYAIHKFFQENGFVYVHTPIITGSDAEGAGEMFRVTTLDPANPPMADGQVDYSQDFFGKETNLTVSGQLRLLWKGNKPYSVRSAGSRNFCNGFQRCIYFRTYFPCGKLKYCKTCIGILDDRAGNGILRP